MQKNVYFGKNKKEWGTKTMSLVTVGAVHTHTHTHTSNLVLNKIKHKHTLYLCNFSVSKII